MQARNARLQRYSSYKNTPVSNTRCKGSGLHHTQRLIEIPAPVEDARLHLGDERVGGPVSASGRR